MGARTMCSAETVLELLTEQVQTVWKSPKHVATMLSLDLSGAYDTVHPVQLLDILCKKRMPGWLIWWVKAFLTDRTTTLVIQGQESDLFEIQYRVPQGSTLSPILFILYTSELLEICDHLKARISAIGFANNTNILTYSTSTKANCRTLEGVHTQCLCWADRHGMKFVPAKYELIYMTHSYTKFNLEASANFEDTEKQPTAEARVLGVWLDTKLCWTAHTWKAIQKGTTQTGALNGISMSTWGATFIQSCLIYLSVVRAQLAYRVLSWHTPAASKAKGVTAKLQLIQNKRLCTITGAYCATPIAILETETYTPLLDLYLDSGVAAFQKRLQGSPVYQQIQNTCQVIVQQLKIKAWRRAQHKTSGEAREEWAAEQHQQLGGTKTSSRTKVQRAWETRWNTLPCTTWDQIRQPPEKKVL